MNTETVYQTMSGQYENFGRHEGVGNFLTTVNMAENVLNMLGVA
jgi:hypothetical protein